MFTVSNGQVMFNGRPADQMTEEERRRAYGTAGNINTDAQTYDFSAGNQYPGNLDPRYWESYEINNGDAGTTQGYRLRPEYERMHGMQQLGAVRSVGGAGEAIDPAGITYDDEFGYLTPLTNVQAPQSTWLQQALPYMLAAANLGAIGAAGGFGGLLGGASGGGTLGTVSGLESITLPALEGAPVLEGLPTMEVMSGGSGLEVSDAMRSLLNQGTTAHGLAADAAAGSAVDGLSAPWYQTMLQNAFSSPVNGLRAGMGLASLIDGIRNAQGGSSPSGSGLLSTGTAPKLDFTGLLSNYTPLQFDPVPFMSGRYGGK